MRNLPIGKIAWLLIAWAFFTALASVGVNVPTVLMVLGTILYLI